MAAAVVVRLLGDASDVGRAFDKAERRGKGFANSAVWKAGAAAVAGLAAVAAKEVFQLGQQFDSAYSDIQRATGATGEQWEALRGEFKDTLGRLPDEMSEVAGAFGSVATLWADSTTAQIGRITEASFDLARLTGDAGAQVAESFSRAAGIFEVDGESASAVLDTLAKVTVDYGIGAGDLTTQLQKQGPFLRAVGFDAEEAAVAIGRLFSEGIDARRVGSAFGFFADRVADLGGDPATALIDIEREIRNAETGADALTIAAEYFGTTGGPTMVAALRDANISLADLGESTNNEADYLANLTERSQTLSDRWAETWNQIRVLIEPVSRALVDLAGVIVGNIIPAIDWLRNLWGQLTGAFSSGSGEISGAVGGLAGTFANIRAAIGNFVAFAQALWQRFGERIVAIVGTYFGGLLNYFRNLWDILVNAFQFFAALFAGDWERVWREVLEFLQSIWQLVLDYLRDALKLAVEVLRLAGQALWALWGLIWKGIQNLLAAAWQGILKLFSIRGGHIVAALKGIGRGLNAVWQALWEQVGNGVLLAWIAIAGIVEGGINGVIKGVESGLNAIIGLVNSLIRTLNRIPGINFGEVGNVSFGRVELTTGLEERLATRRRNQAAAADRARADEFYRNQENFAPDSPLLDFAGIGELDSFNANLGKAAGGLGDLADLLESPEVPSSGGGGRRTGRTAADLPETPTADSDLPPLPAEARTRETNFADRNLELTINVGDETTNFEIPLRDLIDGEVRNIRATAGQSATRPTTCG